MASSPKKQISVGVDIGNTQVITVVGSYDMDTGDMTIIGYGKTPISGMRKGMVIDLEETTATISNSLEEAERMSGAPIDHALISIAGQHIHSSNSRGVVAVSRSSSEIQRDDIERAVEAAKAFSMPANREVIHVISRSFIVDGQEGIKDPLGMKGIRLEVDTHVITASSPVVKNILKCAYEAEIDVDEIVLSSLAAAKILLTGKQKEIGAVLVDIGGAGTNIAIFEEGEVVHTAFIPIGASHITNDIAIGLRTSIESAEKVKVEYGAAHPKMASERDVIDLSLIDSSADKANISRKYIVEIINARLEEIFAMVKDELRRIGRDGLLPAGAILTGGGSSLPGIVDVARENLRLPAQLGEIIVPITSIDKAILLDPSFTTAIGLSVWGLESKKSDNLVKSVFEGLRGASNVIDKIKNLFSKK
ncbi:cell division protein FtsA [Candidatus Microgenomates bacterium]|nr:cell division protein FtsA [Candidatus Microgenomates bacterium]